MALESLTRYVAELARLGARPALIEQRLYRTEGWSYAELLGRAFAFQEELQRRGVRPGDRVLLWGHAGAAWAIAFYGCLLSGVVIVPLDAAFSAGYVRRVQTHTDAVLLCASSAHAAHVPEMVALSFDEITALPARAASPGVIESNADTLLEIVYTSGTTAEPRGVMITHGNLLANLRPIHREIQKYKPKAKLLLPLRFVHLIPLSHLFGQVMGLLIPTLLESCVIFPESQLPEQLATIIRQHRASVMVCVPQQVELMSAWALQQLRREVPGGDAAAVAAASKGHGIAWRWWHWRRLHRRLGWKMWAFIVGGAALPPRQEEIWNALGYAVVQGYGLTETAPAIAITHPFKIQRGAVGRKLAGMEIKIAGDGEILVRGGNVSPGYYRNPEATAETFAEGWLHTGDLGALDENGNLIFRGRKKEVIVTADGLNVFPQDVEAALDRQPEIRESAVVGESSDNGLLVHAVAVLRPGQDESALAAAVARANEELEPHQRIRAFSRWPEEHLPRTASTHKLQRVTIARWVNRRQSPAAVRTAATAGDWRDFLQERLRIPAERMRPEARLSEDLGLSSLDRVELLSWIEANTAASVDEADLATAATVGDLSRLIEQNGHVPAAAPARAASAVTGGETRPAPAFSYPQWPLSGAARGFRSVAFSSLLMPLLRTVARVEVRGVEHVRDLRRPVLFVANHQSLLDVPVIVRALPLRLRPWLAPAMGADAFRELFLAAAPRALRRRARRHYRLTQLFFNTYLLAEQSGIKNALRHSGHLADRGYCPLIFPEGARTRTGELGPFRPGIGVFIEALGLPVVPVIVEGLFEILPIGAERAKRGTARVTFAPPLDFSGQSPEQIRAELETWYRRHDPTVHRNDTLAGKADSQD